jgi:hypothetical protein
LRNECEECRRCSTQSPRFGSQNGRIKLYSLSSNADGRGATGTNRASFPRHALGKPARGSIARGLLPARDPPVVSAQASRLRQTLDSAKTEGIKYAFIDTAGRKDESAVSAASAADLVLIPSHPRLRHASRQSPFIGNGSSSNEHDKRRQSASQNSQSKPVRNRGQKTWQAGTNDDTASFWPWRERSSA